MTDQTVLTVGVGKQFQTINAAIQAADQMGGNADIKVDAGTYTNDGGYLWDGINNVTIEGVGGMAKIVDPTYYAGGKAAIVTGGQNIALKNLDISGVTVPDGNGAGIRYDQGTLLLDNVHLHNNQNGILGGADAAGSITIQNSEIDHNGTSAGNTHNIYIGDVANFTLTNSYVHDANVGHEVKSRAENNTITNNRILDNGGTSSYAIDLPNGGNATITGNVIEQGANNPNHTINAYGEEGNLHAGTTVNFSGNTVVNDDAEGRGPLWANNGATITGTGNTAWNAADLGNGVNPASFTALSARPTLDTSSTNTNPAPAGGGSTTTTPTTGGSTSTPVTYPTQTVLTVGVGKQFQTINAAIQAADQMGGNADIKVDAGTYTNDGGYLWDGINNVTIEGVGGMAKIVDPTYYAGGKAAIVTGGQNIALKNLDISGVTVPDGNGAGIRYDQGTLLLDNVHLHNNQNGILGGADAAGSITIQNSEIDHNGTSAGNTHNIYIGDVANFTLTNSYVHDANVGHEVKSRAENNTITNNRILDNGGTSSYAIDLPNGGNATITGNVIEQGANNPNHTINAYGEEGNLHAGTTVNFSGNTVVNDDAEGRGPLWANNGATITGTGNTAWNAADLGNGVNPASFTALSARPTLDTSSTNTNPAPAGGGSTTTTPTTGGSTSTPVTYPTQTVLTVGVGKQFQTINAAIQAADQMGGNADIKVDAGTYTNDGGYLWDGINNVTIEGVGGMAKIVDPTYYAGGKAAIVTGGQNIALKNLDISGVTVPDGNGAGIRYDQGTLLLDNVHLHNNQNGILGGADAAGSITIQNSEIDHNGTSAGNTHNIYIGDVANFTLTNSYVHDANVGHEVKSRAENNTITNNRILDNGGTSSYAIDLPNGGNATITGNVIEQGANNPNHTINAYGEEGNLHAGTTVNFSGNTVVNDDAEGRGPLWANNGATITGTGNTAWNAADLGNGVNPASFTALSARPTLDTSSTNTNPAPAGGGSTTTTPTTGGSTSTPVTYPTQTVLTVGVGKQFQTINAAIQAADQMGGNADIKVDAGTYTNDGGYLWDGINNVTIEGVGGMAKIVDPTYYAGGKAAIVTGGQNIALKNLDISGVTVPDGNGAGIRYDQGTLLLDNVHLHNNQNGILGGADAAGSITIQNSEIDHNGTSAGNTHNIYIGDVANFTLTNSYVHDANVGHEVKSRAENNTITNNRILDNGGTSSYAIDLPNGGNATITGNVIEQGANNPNHTINAYGEEGNLHAGTTVNFSGNTVVNDDAEGRGPLWANNGATITGTGNTAWNAADLGNGVNPASFTALSARPTLDTSSTNTNPAPAGGGSTTTTPTTGGSTSTPVTYPTQTVLTVGVGKQFQTINAAIQAADQMGGNADIKVDAGTYTNDGGYLWDGINNVTIEGVGGMAKIVDPTYYAGGKAAIVTGGQNIALKNLDISGVTVPDGNGAGIRYDQGTLLLDNVHLHNNQNGILGGADAAGSITIQNSEIDHNGTSAGNTHNIYIGDVANFTLTNSYVHDANVGHEVKSRAENNTITNNRILDNGGTSSYAIDLPNGGNATITGNVIEQGANNPNHTINAYGEEGNLHAGTTVNFSGNTVVNDDAEGRGPLWANNGATITGTGNTAWNAADLGNGVNPASFTALSARPTLDTSSTNTNPAPAGGGSTTTTPTTGSSDLASGSTGNNVTPIGGSSTPAHITAPPTITVSQSVFGTTTSTSNTLSGTVTDSGSGIGAVEIFINSAGRSIDLGPAPLNGNTWSYTASNLSPGTYTFYAVGFDRVGNSTAPIQVGPSQTVVTTLPPIIQPPLTVPSQHITAPPTITVSQSVFGTTTSTSNTLSGTVTDSGSGIGAVEIFINSAGRSIDLGPAPLNGNTWSYTASNLSPGTYTFYAVGFDRVGNSTAPIQVGPSQTVVTAVGQSDTPQAQVAQTILPTAAADFVSSIGVNTHFDNIGSSYDDMAKVINSLKYLGVENVRDSMAAPNDASLFRTVAAATGVKFDAYLSLSQFGYDAQIAEMKAISDLLTAAEGINEGDSALTNMSYGGQTGYAAIAAAQSALFSAMKSDPNTQSVKVIGPSYGNTSSFSEAVKTENVSDLANTHEYFGTGNPPGAAVSAFLAQASLVSGTKNAVATEAGYYTGPSLSGSIAAYQHSGVSELVQAKYNLTLLFSDWKAGVKTTYFYELLDRYNDPGNTNSESHFGLFNADGTPKMAATALHNLVTTLADDGPARSDVFGYQIAGAPTTANSLLMEKSSGTFDLAVWNDIRLASSTTGADVENLPTPVRINFGQYVQSVSEYDPLVGTSSILSRSNVDHVDVNLPDHPVIFEIVPYAPAGLSLANFVLPETVASSQSTGDLAGMLLANAISANYNNLVGLRISSVDLNGTKGTVSFNASQQSVIYSAPFYSPLSPTDSFSYTLSDEKGNSVSGTVAITGTAPAKTTYGTIAGDRINAPDIGWTLASLTTGQELYSDYSGTIFIGGADTRMFGGTDNNVFTAGDGSHVIGAGANSRINLGNGDNTIGLTGSGSIVVTGDGNNLLYKSTGNTSISMGNGNQNITAGGENNTIRVGIGNSTIDVGTDGSIAGSERVTVGGGTNVVRVGGSNNTIVFNDGSNQLLSQGSAANILIKAGSNNLIVQGNDSVLNIASGVNTIGTNGVNDIVTLGSGSDTIWAGGDYTQITAGSGSSFITFIGQHDTIDLTHGTSTVMAQGTNATIIFGGPELTPAQIFGNALAANDVFDLRTTLAATDWDGRQNTLANYLSVESKGNSSVITVDVDGAGSKSAASIASLNDVAGLTYNSLLAHSIVPAWR